MDKSVLVFLTIQLLLTSPIVPLSCAVQAPQLGTQRIREPMAQPLSISIVEDVSIYGDGRCQLTIAINMSSSPIAEIYRDALGLGDINLESHERIPINETVPVPVTLNTNATDLAGGYSQVSSMAGYNGTSITNTTYADTPSGTAISGQLQVEDAQGGNLSQPIQQDFLNAIIQEQWHSFGIQITDIRGEMWGMNEACVVVVDANASLQLVSCGDVAIGPADINASLNRAGFIFTKVAFIQQMLRNVNGDTQTYEYNATWLTNFSLTGDLTLTENNYGDLVSPPRVWTIDFGGGTQMNASILACSTPKNLALKETMLVTDVNVTIDEYDLVENFLGYKIFHLQLLQPVSMYTSTFEVGGVGIRNNWDWHWSIHLWEGQFTLEWSNVRMDVYADLALEGEVRWKFKWFRLKYCKAWTSLQAHSTINISANGELDQSWCKTLFEWSSRYTVWIGPFPVVMTLEFEPVATLSVGMQLMPGAEAWCGLNLTGYFKVGVGWERDEGWRMIYGSSMEAQPFDPDIRNATADVAAWMRPSLQFRLGVLFYELAGPYVELEPYVTIFAEYTVSPENLTYWIDVGVNINAGIKFTGCLKKLLRLSDFHWQLWGRILWSTREDIPEHDVRVTNVNSQAQGFVTEPISFYVGLLNKGTEEELVNVTLCYQNTTTGEWDEIDADMTELAAGNWRTVNFTWNTQADLSAGNYTVMANATIQNPDPSPGDNNDTAEIRLEVRNIAVIEVTTNASVVNAGQPVEINVTVANAGTVNTSVVATTAYFNGHLLSSLWWEHTRWLFNFPNGTSRILTYTWDTAGVEDGSYIVSANASLIQYDVAPDDNMGASTGQVTINPSMIRQDLAITQVTSWKTTVGQGYGARIEVTVLNEGEISLGCSVAVCANATLIGTKEVMLLAPGQSMLVNFTWNTEGWDMGNYRLCSTVYTSPNETDTTDNTYVDGWILVTIPGDVDGDYDVDIFDIVVVCGSYGLSEDHAEFVPNADIDDDGDVDIYDVVIAASNYSKSVSPLFSQRLKGIERLSRASEYGPYASHHLSSERSFLDAVWSLVDVENGFMNGRRKMRIIKAPAA